MFIERLLNIFTPFQLLNKQTAHFQIKFDYHHIVFPTLFILPVFHVQLDVQEVTVDVPADALIQDGGVQQVTLDIVFIPTESSADVVNAAGDDRYRSET